MSIAIVRYNAGNVRSVEFALRRLGVEPLLTDDADELRAADRVIFPGVGEARSSMSYLRERGLDEVIRSLTQPVLGICLGLQLLCEHSEENDTTCLGVFPHRVRKFNNLPGAPRPDGTHAALKVPQIGWNRVRHDGKGVFTGEEAEPYMYFVHSYYAETGPLTVAETEYGIPFSSGMRRDNFHAVQFHPEKSADPGAALLRAFLDA
ncbi:MAG: imidazole glycerol phosphate synthase subunit HisH [Rhodothermales bacterium]